MRRPMARYERRSRLRHQLTDVYMHLFISSPPAHRLAIAASRQPSDHPHGVPSLRRWRLPARSVRRRRVVRAPGGRQLSSVGGPVALSRPSTSHGTAGRRDFNTISHCFARAIAGGWRQRAPRQVVRSAVPTGLCFAACEQVTVAESRDASAASTGFTSAEYNVVLNERAYRALEGVGIDIKSSHSAAGIPLQVHRGPNPPRRPVLRRAAATSRPPEPAAPTDH